MLVDIDGHAILADFGLSKQVDNLQSLNESHVGTEEYMAPELVAKKKYDYMVDFYSLGVVVYELLMGKTPFPCRSTDGGKFAENVHKKEPQIPAKFSPELKDFLARLLAKDPAKRLGAVNGADEIIAHPWLSDIDFRQIALGQIPAPINVDTTHLNHVLSELDLEGECELDEENPKVGRGVRTLSEFSFSEDIVKEVASSLSDETEETQDSFSDNESYLSESNLTQEVSDLKNVNTIKSNGEATKIILPSKASKLKATKVAC